MHGMPTSQALDAFAIAYENALREAPGRPFKVIHGYGSSGEGGHTRNAIRSWLGVVVVADMGAWRRSGRQSRLHAGLSGKAIEGRGADA